MTELQGAKAAEILPAVVNSVPTKLSIFDREPDDMVLHATKIANSLKKIIVSQNLAVKLGQGYHIKAEGWSTLCTMLGIVPREKEVIRHEDGSYEAKVELYSIAADKIVGNGSAICDSSWRNWKNSESNSRRSMAITRAMGKSCRLGLGWIVALAGYDPCPAEEMDHPHYSAPEPAEKPAVKIFELGNKDHESLVEKYLKSKKVDKKLWQRVTLVMSGKPITQTQMDDIINSVQAKEPNSADGSTK